MTLSEKLSNLLTFPRLLAVLLLLQALFLFQLALIWNLSDQLRQRQELLQAPVEEEEIVTPGMIRGL